jgi:hypothetical protein
VGDPSDAVVRAVVAGDLEAWRQLATALAPQIESIARSHPAMRKRGLGVLSDDVAEIRTAVLERLTRDGHRNLSRYLQQRDACETSRAQSFDSWVYGATDFAVREHLRKRFGRMRPSEAALPGQRGPSRRDLATNAVPIDDESPDRSYIRQLGVTTRLSLAEIFAYIDAEFDRSERRAIRLYYQDERSFAEIALELRLGDAREAEKLIRRLNARLRHRFAAPSDS